MLKLQEMDLFARVLKYKNVQEITESINVESQFLNGSLTSLNENIDFSIMKKNTKISAFEDQ